MKKNYCFAILAIVAALFALTAQAMAYQIGGNVNNPGEYTTAGSLWVVLEGPDAFGANSAYPYQYDCYPGTTLPCITLPQPPYDENNINHNTVDSNYVLVTGGDGSRSLFAVGELNPKFAPAGYAATITCDKRGWCDLVGEGRVVRNVSEIDVFQAVPSIHLNGSTFPFTHFYSPLIIVSGAGITPKSFDLAELQAMDQVTLNASSSTTNTVGIWKGPTLRSVLKASGVDDRDMDSIDSYIIVQATDGYAAVLSMYEATHMTGGQYPMLAVSGLVNSSETINNCKCSTDKDNGLARLILPNDIAAGRWVSNVAQIIVYKLEECKDHWR